MEILEEGIYTNKQLAQWFGIKENTFRSKKKNKLEELKNYVDFVEIGSKIKITKVYFNTYIKKQNKSYKKVQELVEKNWSTNGFDTCSHVKELIKTDETLQHLADATIYTYVRKAHIENFGHPAKEDGGAKGVCYYKWGKRDKDDNKKPIYFTDEEKAYFFALIKKVFQVDPEMAAKEQALYQAYKKKEMSKEEYYEQRDILDEEKYGKWSLVEEGMFERFGIQLIRGTQEDFEKVNPKKGMIQ